MANERKIDRAILGLLSYAPLTGYEIKKRMDTPLKFFWGASFGSIYPTLRELVTKEMVTMQKEQENGRNKNVYTITQKGLLNLRDWLKNPTSSDELRYETLLKLFFGVQAGTEQSIILLENFKEKFKSQQQDIQHMIHILETEKKQDDPHLYYLLTAKFGDHMCRAYLEWCDETERILKNKTVKKGSIL